jgi:hypothetical protein
MPRRGGLLMQSATAILNGLAGVVRAGLCRHTRLVRGDAPASTLGPAWRCRAAFMSRQRRGERAGRSRQGG